MQRAGATSVVHAQKALNVCNDALQKRGCRLSADKSLLLARANKGATAGPPAQASHNARPDIESSG